MNLDYGYHDDPGQEEWYAAQWDESWQVAEFSLVYWIPENCLYSYGDEPDPAECPNNWIVMGML